MIYDSDDVPVVNPHRQVSGGWAPLAHQVMGDDDMFGGMMQPPGYPSCAGADPELFFPDQNHGRWTNPVAKRICGNCPIVQWCKDTHIMEAYGIWGGLSERERRAERHRRGVYLDDEAVSA